MRANRHETTGVRFAIYHINNDLHPDVWDDIYAGTNLSERAVLDEMELRVRRALQELPDEVLPYLNIEQVAEELMETALVNGLDDTLYRNDEPVYEGETDGIKWRTTYLGGAPHLIVLESPYYGVGRVCSPCVPDALDGSTVISIFMDEAAAEANRYHNDSGGETRSCVGYCLPSTWLNDEAVRHHEDVNSSFDMHEGL